MSGNSGAGRPKGALNRRTAALMELVEAGESPAAFGLRIMRDEISHASNFSRNAFFASASVSARPWLGCSSGGM